MPPKYRRISRNAAVWTWSNWFHHVLANHWCDWAILVWKWDCPPIDTTWWMPIRCLVAHCFAENQSSNFQGKGAKCPALWFAMKRIERWPWNVHILRWKYYLLKFFLNNCVVGVTYNWALTVAGHWCRLFSGILVRQKCQIFNKFLKNFTCVISISDIKWHSNSVSFIKSPTNPAGCLFAIDCRGEFVKLFNMRKMTSKCNFTLTILNWEIKRSPKEASYSVMCVTVYCMVKTMSSIRIVSWWRK